MKVRQQSIQEVLRIKEYLNLKAENMEGAGLLQTMFLSLMTILMQVRHQSIPEMLRMNESSNLIGQECF